MSVVLPEPEAPMRATSSPASTVNEMPFNTGTSSSPMWYVLKMSFSSIRFMNGFRKLSLCV